MRTHGGPGPIRVPRPAAVGAGRLSAPVVVLALVLGACSPAGRPGAAAPTSATTTSAPTTTTSAPTTTTTTVPVPPVAPVQWTSCGSLQCATVAVPLDYADPGRGMIQIALSRHPADDPAERIGSLVINPGGPGGSGIDDLPDELRVLTPELLDRFDIVSFDPRGVERSSPVLCGANGGSSTSTPGPLPDPVPTTAAAQQALFANDRAYAQQCEEHSGAVLPFVGTVDTARDLDRIRQALGDTKLTFIGHSYGTLLGATYAQMFPANVRAMVLDGAIDPAMGTDQMVIEQAEGFEGVLGQFFSWCASTGCAWRGGGDPVAALLGLVDQSRQRPIPAGGSRTAGPGELYDAVLDSMYSTSSWPSLANALAAAAAGNGAPVVALADSYLTFNGSNAVDAETAIDCLDHPVSTDLSSYPALALQAAVDAPVFGPLFAWGIVGCAVWPVPPTRTPAPATAVGSAPILVTGATGDPATPYSWAQNLASELQHGVLLTWRGNDHVAYYYSACVRAADQAYLIQGTLPAPGTVCSD